MKSKTFAKKMSLNKSTIAHLDRKQLENLKGGYELTDVCTYVCTGDETKCPAVCGPFQQESWDCNTYNLNATCMRTCENSLCYPWSCDCPTADCI